MATDQRLINARAIAANLREAATLCTAEQEPIRVRFIQAAQALDETVGMVEAATFIARLNHDTIVGISQ